MHCNIVGPQFSRSGLNDAASLGDSSRATFQRRRHGRRGRRRTLADALQGGRVSFWERHGRADTLRDPKSEPARFRRFCWRAPCVAVTQRLLGCRAAYSVSRASASRYLAAVFSITSGGSLGGGGALFHGWVSSQSRTNCLSKLGGLRPAANAASYSSAGQ